MKTISQNDKTLKEVQLGASAKRSYSHSTKIVTIHADSQRGAAMESAEDGSYSSSSMSNENDYIKNWAPETLVTMSHAKVQPWCEDSCQNSSFTQPSFSWSTLDESLSPSTLPSTAHSLMTLSFVVRSPLTISSHTRRPYTASAGTDSPFTGLSGTRSPFTESSGFQTYLSMSVDERSEASSVHSSRDDDDFEDLDSFTGHHVLSDALLVLNKDPFYGIFDFGGSRLPRPVVMQDIYPNRLSVSRVPPTSPRISSMHVPVNALFPKSVKSDDILLLTSGLPKEASAYTEMGEGTAGWKAYFNVQMYPWMKEDDKPGNNHENPDTSQPKAFHTEQPDNAPTPVGVSAVAKMNSKDFYTVVSTVTILKPMELLEILIHMFSCAGSANDSDDDSDFSVFDREPEDDSSYESMPKPIMPEPMRLKKKGKCATLSRDKDGRDDLDALVMAMDGEQCPLGISPRETMEDDFNVSPAFIVETQLRLFEQMKRKNQEARRLEQRQKAVSAPQLSFRQLSPTTAFSRVSRSANDQANPEHMHKHEHEVPLNVSSSSDLSAPTEIESQVKETLELTESPADSPAPDKMRKAEELVDDILDALADDIILRRPSTPINERQHFLDHRREMYLNLKATSEVSPSSDEEIALRTSLSSFEAMSKHIVLDFSFADDDCQVCRQSQSWHSRTNELPIPFEHEPTYEKRSHSCREKRTVTDTLSADDSSTLPIEQENDIVAARRRVLLERRAALQARQNGLACATSSSTAASLVIPAPKPLNPPRQVNTILSGKNTAPTPDALPRVSSGPCLMETSGKILAMKNALMRRNEKEKEPTVLSVIPSMSSANTASALDSRAMGSRQTLNRHGKLNQLRKVRGANATKAFSLNSTSSPHPKSQAVRLR